MSPGVGGRPATSEHAPYYGRYIEQVADGDVLETLERQMRDTRALLAGVPAARETFRYAPDKWSLREVVGHLIDVERTFTLRALWFARGAGSPLPSLEQDEWAAASNAGGRALSELMDEWAAVRDSGVRMFRGFDAEAWSRAGVASGFPFTVRSIPWIIAGHEVHHRRLIAERYLGVAA